MVRPRRTLRADCWDDNRFDPYWQGKKPTAKGIVSKVDYYSNWFGNSIPTPTPVPSPISTPILMPTQGLLGLPIFAETPTPSTKYLSLKTYIPINKTPYAFSGYYGYGKKTILLFVGAGGDRLKQYSINYQMNFNLINKSINWELNIEENYKISTTADHCTETITTSQLVIEYTNGTSQTINLGILNPDLTKRNISISLTPIGDYPDNAYVEILGSFEDSVIVSTNKKYNFNAFDWH